MFIELWQGLRDLMHDNNSETAANEAKRFINWTIRDLALEYDWEFLRGTQDLTAVSGSGVYDLKNIIQPSATNTTIYIQSTNPTADLGQVITIYGKNISASATVCVVNSSITVTTATASGGQAFSHIDYVTKNTTSGSIIITTNAGNIKCTLKPTDTFLSNDISKINKVISKSSSEIVVPYDYNDYQRGNPNGSNLGDIKAYDVDHQEKLRLFNVNINEVFEIAYQRLPKYLLNDIDRTEFPGILYQKIILASYEGYGLRYRDEEDAALGKQRYNALLKSIVQAWVQGKDRKRGRIIPTWYKRII